MRKFGVDISEMNGNVDFSALKTAGVEFVIIRTGYGLDYPGQQDACFQENVEKAIAAGIPWGAYHYSYARDSAGGLAEAEHAKRILNRRVPPYGLWLDMEDEKTLGGNLPAVAETFCMAFENIGVYVGVYASASWWSTYLTSPVFNRWDKWVAQYNTTLEYGNPGKNVGIWQYTDEFVVSNKNFDGNWCFKDYPTITRREEFEMTYEQWKKYQQRYEQEQAEKPVSEWAENAVNFVKDTGIMIGDKNGEFRPRSPISRQEVAEVLYNMAKKGGAENGN